MIRVCLVDDQTLVRQGIRSLLELSGDIEIAAEAANGNEAIEVIRSSRPDVVLLDVRMPYRSGIEVLKELQEIDMLPPTIVLTTFDDHMVVIDAIRAGAKGYLLKDVSLEELVGAIKTVFSGGTLIRPAVTEHIIKRWENSSRDVASTTDVDPLTEREMEVLRLMGGGYSNREIASALYVAEGTVKNHVSSILSKLGVRDRTRAVLKAMELGHI